MVTTTHHITSLEEKVWQALENVKDPEIPVLSVVDMGMISGIDIRGNESVRITLTPTFVGCPAINVIKQSIITEMQKLDFSSAEVQVDYETPWTSNRMSSAAKEKLEKFGLAPPAKLDNDLTEAQLNSVRCPHCHSTDTTLRSSFGSTLCRAVRFCFNCQQSFEQFKPV